MRIKNKTKSYRVSKAEVMSAWKRVKSNNGVAGVDGENIAKFEENLTKNLYKLWNRMNAGTYFPKAVRRVEIPKHDGSTRPLGIPTVYDRIAQEVVRAKLEPVLEEVFVTDSYGFRPNKSAHQAVTKCRSMSIKYDWVIDLDISKYFDTIDHDLLIKAVQHHCKSKWMLLYIKRWLKAPIVYKQGSERNSERNSEQGTPQGGVISPLLANLYLHYCFDMWIARTYPHIQYERYADDIIIHSKTEQEAKEILASIISRFAECKLKLNDKKTQIVYCKDCYRRAKNEYPTKYDFLGFTFRARRLTQKDGKIISRFLPSASNKAKKRLRGKVKKLINNKTTHLNLESLNKLIQPVLLGWYNYFKTFSTSNDLGDIWWYTQIRISNWMMRKWKIGATKVGKFLHKLRREAPKFFVHWKFAHNYDWTRRAV